MQQQAKRHPKFFLQALLIAGLALLHFPQQVYCDYTAQQLPDIGDPIAGLISPEEEHKQGRVLLTEIRRQLPLLQDYIVNYYLSELGQKLVSANYDSQFPFTFLVANNAQINAFAAPGGIIVVNTGLIETAHNESELAAVLAHEIAHVTQRHIARYYYQSSQFSLKSALGLLAAIIVSSYSPQAAEAAFYTGIAASVSDQLKFTRENEKEADRIGAKTLEHSGFDTAAIARFFQRLDEESLTNSDDLASFLHTHPVTTSRIADAKARERHDPAAIKDSSDFQLIKARIIGLTGSSADISRHSRSQQSNQLVIRAVSAIKHNQAEKTLQLIDQLPASQKRNLQVQYLQAHALIKLNQYAKAGEILHSLHSLYPSHPAFLAMSSELFIIQNEPDKAWQLLNRSEINFDHWPQLYKIKADAAGRNGLTLHSHESLARYYELQGNTHLALEQVKTALKNPDMTPVMKARLEKIQKRLLERQKEEQRQTRYDRQ